MAKKKTRGKVVHGVLSSKFGAIGKFQDGISFGHENMQSVVRAKMAKNYQKYQISVKTMVVVHET